jgi:type IV secretory pathway TrbD component
VCCPSFFFFFFFLISLIVFIPNFSCILICVSWLDLIADFGFRIWFFVVFVMHALDAIMRFVPMAEREEKTYWNRKMD